MIFRQASDFIEAALPVIRRDMGDESPDDPIGIMKTSAGLGPVTGQELRDLTALALRRLAAHG